MPQKKKKQLIGRRKKGDALLTHVVKLTGLPTEVLTKELKEILERKNINLNHLNLEQLRTAAASYVREIMTSLLDRCHLRKNDSLH